MRNFKEIRCVQCNKMIAKDLEDFKLEIKCPRCGTLNNTLKYLPEQIIVTDLAGKILYINKATEINTGYLLHEAIGKKPSELWGGHMSSKFYKTMWRDMLEKKTPIKFSIKNKKKTGEMYQIELLVSPILDTNNNILFFVGIENKA